MFIRFKQVVFTLNSWRVSFFKQLWTQCQLFRLWFSDEVVGYASTEGQIKCIE